MALSKEEIADWFRSLQKDIIRQIEDADGGSSFHFDEWSRPGGGGGLTSVIENGGVIEKGGVNFSAVHGELPRNIAEALKVDSQKFFATGVSIVMHPFNPFVPIIHMNVRYFEMNEDVWWFGGGIDLTPHYVNEAQANAFHAELEASCSKHDSTYYKRFAEWADKYFYNKHRKESRGVGGIFFDRLNSTSEGKSKDALFSFVQDIGKTFGPVYSSLMKSESGRPFTDLNKEWQFLRRSRYAEFNLVYDKGTKFGLDTNGRIESILMSLPPETGWKYSQSWPEGGEEEATAEYLRTVHVPSS